MEPLWEIRLIDIGPVHHPYIRHKCYHINGPMVVDLNTPNLSKCVYCGSVCPREVWDRWIATRNLIYG